MTLTTLPDDARVRVDAGASRVWGEAVRPLTPDDPRAYYDWGFQSRLRDAARAAAPRVFDATIAAVRARLESAPHLVVVEGIDWSAGDALIVAVNAGFGRITAGGYQPPRGQIVSRLGVQTELAGPKGPMRGAERMHSDNGYRATPARLLTMVCHAPDPGGGGVTRIITARELRGAIAAQLGTDVERWFEETPLPWRVTDPHDGVRYTDGLAEIQGKLTAGRVLDTRGQGVAWRPILAGSDLLWSRRIIEDGFRLLGRTPSREVVARLDAFQGVLDGMAEWRVALRAGDYMVADNLRTVHSRTPLTERYAASTRLMLRCWVHDPVVGAPGGHGFPALRPKRP